MIIVDMDKLINCDTSFSTDQLKAIKDCSREVTDTQINELLDGYIKYRCEKAASIQARPLSWFSIDSLLNQDLILPMDFSTYVSVLRSL
jgi:hypothetical protein